MAIFPAKFPENGYLSRLWQSFQAVAEVADVALKWLFSKFYSKTFKFTFIDS